MTPEDYLQRDATGLAELVERGEVSSRELAQTAIDQINELNPGINAVIETDFERALDAVDHLPTGPLRGVPWLIKDLNTTAAGLHDTNGSRALDGPAATDDSELVARHRRAGLVLLGKTNTPEFGMNVCTAPSRYGPTRHPLDGGRSVGGSSGGSAAAVASGMIPAAHATDSGGSIRIPASNCGLFGLKPSRARVPLGNDSSEGLGGLSTGHAVTHSVRDSALILDLTHGPLQGDGYAAPSPAGSFLDAVNGAPPSELRIGLCTTGFAGEEIHPTCVSAATGVGQLLESLGHHVEPVGSPVEGERLRDVLDVLFTVHIAAAVTSFPSEEHIARLELSTQAAIVHARRYSGADLVNALADARLITGQLGQFFGEYDLLLTPTLAHPARPIGYHDPTEPDWSTYLQRLLDDIAFTPLFNASGGPAMNLPLNVDEHGLPVGVQLGARLGNEEMLLRLARQVELATPWHNRG